jgi:class 3 adenylate cyclase
MAVFTGDYKNTSAVTAALKINAAVNQVINSALSSAYPTQPFRVNHSIGIDTSEIHVARIGVRGEGDNDLVWVGRAANHAAKLTTLATGTQRIWISEAVYRKMPNDLKILDIGGSAWQAHQWSNMNNATVYSSHAWHPID